MKSAATYTPSAAFSLVPILVRPGTYYLCPLLQEDGYIENKTRSSGDKGVARHSVTRTSINPLNLLVGAIGGAVETVANSGEHESFKSLVHK